MAGAHVVYVAWIATISVIAVVELKILMGTQNGSDHLTSV
jgi:hypothetical protein